MNMEIKSTHRLPVYIVIAFSLCLCNLVLRELAPNGGICPACTSHPHLAEHGGIPDPSHAHDHEDDFIYAELASPSANLMNTGAIGSADLPPRSRLLAPPLPPPKAA
jgi:hypothetical protein